MRECETDKGAKPAVDWFPQFNCFSDLLWQFFSLEFKKIIIMLCQCPREHSYFFSANMITTGSDN